MVELSRLVSNEHSVSIEFGEFLDQRSDCQLLKNQSAPWVSCWE